MATPRTIRKYPNRRLYDAAKCGYITLTDVRGLVLERISFVVIDSHTETDITASVLMQVLAITGELDSKQLIRLIRAQHRGTDRSASSPGP